MGQNDKTVSQRPNGEWADKRDGTARAAGLYQTQKEAADAARTHLHQSGGGQLKIKGESGKIRAKGAIAPGHDPRRSKG